LILFYIIHYQLSINPKFIRSVPRQLRQTSQTNLMPQPHALA